MLVRASSTTLDHLSDQVKLVRLVQLQSTANWSLLDFKNLDASSLEWLDRQTRIVLAGRERAAVQAANAYQEARVAQLGERLLARPPSVVNPAAVSQAVTSLRVSGPVAVKQAMAGGATQQQGMSLGLARVLGASQRLVMGGDRSMFVNLVGLERGPMQWARVTTGSNPCDYCLMLASRGAVYDKDTVDFVAHDNCFCMPQPEFVRPDQGKSSSPSTPRDKPDDEDKPWLPGKKTPERKRSLELQRDQLLARFDPTNEWMVNRLEEIDKELSVGF